MTQKTGIYVYDNNDRAWGRGLSGVAPKNGCTVSESTALNCDECSAVDVPMRSAIQNREWAGFVLRST